MGLGGLRSAEDLQPERPSDGADHGQRHAQFKDVSKDVGHGALPFN